MSVDQSNIRTLAEQLRGTKIGDTVDVMLLWTAADLLDTAIHDLDACHGILFAIRDAVDSLYVDVLNTELPPANGKEPTP